MNSHTPPDGNSPFPNEIDLSDIFIGREQQLDQFRFYLERWQRLTATSSILDLKAPPSPNDKIQGFVVLLHGRGGFGKSTLLKRYREITLEYSTEIQVSDLIDWEFAAQERRALFNPAQRDVIDASQYFSFLRDQLALALGRPRTDFKEYQMAVRAVDDAKKQAQGILKGLQQDDRYAWLRSLPGEVVLALIQSVPVVKNLLLPKDDAITKVISDATNAGVAIGVEQIRQVWTRLHERLGNDLNDFLNAPWRLGRAIGHDLAQLARRCPILIFFDTYEEIDEGDKLLQMIMGAAGGRVGWVIAGRDNLWAGLSQRLRTREMEYGYKDLVPPDRRLVVDFSADGVGDFTSSDIEEYFTQLSRKALRPALPAVSEKDAVHIRDVTGGVPLAVKIAAGLYLESQDLALITESLDGKREIVDQMVERYLLHTRTNPADRTRLYGLALLRRPDEQRALAAALDVPDNYDAELARLHRRYGFIFTRQEQPALHQEVRHFLRLWLLQHRTSSPEIMRVISRLREALFTSFQELETQRHYTSLRERLEDEQWVALYLDLTEQQFWLDPAEGVAYVLPFMFAASVYQREANRVARTIGEFFQATLVQPYRKQWDWANQSLVYSTSRNPLPEELSGLKDVVRLASQNKVAFYPPVPPFQEGLEAAVWWRLGEAYRGGNPNECVDWYEKALGRLPHEEDLREALTEAKLDREPAATLPGGTHDGTTTSDAQRTMAELNRALERDPKSVRAYIQRGDAYAARKEYQRAITDFDRALELDTRDASLYTKRGETYLLLKEYRRTIADFDHALELAPQDASLYAKRGEAYLLLREYRRAIADFDHALELAPQDASLYAKRGEAYLLLKEYRRALVDFEHALELEPGNEAIHAKRNEASLELTRSQQASPPVPQRPVPSLRISRLRTLMGLGVATPRPNSRIASIRIGPITVLILLAILLLLVSTAGAAIRFFFLLPPELTIVTNLNDDGPGSLRFVIDTARAGSTIRFAPDLRGTIFLRSNDLVFSKNLMIRGPGSSILTISGGNSGHIVDVLDGHSVTMSDLSFKDSNTGKAGVGFIENDGTLKLINTTVSGNTSSGTGGGIFNNNTSSLTLINSTVSSNSAPYGGGIYNYNGALTVINSTISGNKAVAQDASGGGIYDFGPLTLINSTVSGNATSGTGGGITVFGSRATITFCTIYNNTAHDGGGFSIQDRGAQHSLVEVGNSIVAGNHARTSPDISGKLISDGYNLIQDTSGTTFDDPLNKHSTDISGDINGNVGIDPVLRDNGGSTKTLALLPGSPAIDEIPLDACLIKDIMINDIITDQRGVKRPQGPACDIGAYEAVLK